MVEPERTEQCRDEQPLYPIGIAAELLGATDQTLRLYEKHGLLKPARRGKNRYFSDNDIKWVKCLRRLLHEKKISLEGLKMLLEYAPCWEIQGCNEDQRRSCRAYVDRSAPCWKLAQRHCKSDLDCQKCVVYLGKH